MIWIERLQREGVYVLTRKVEFEKDPRVTADKANRHDLSVSVSDFSFHLITF